MPQVLNIPVLHNVFRKQPVIHVWEVSECSLGSQYARVWIYKGREYAKVPYGSV